MFEDIISDEERNEDNLIDAIEVKNEHKIGHNQFYDIVTSRKPDWQSVIYELIDSEHLDPWDIDLIILTERYFEKIEELEEMDFYVSSKVILAAALLLRIKSEFLLNRYMRSIDDILFGNKEEKKEIERMEIDDEDLPILIPKTPLPRSRKVTLQELMNALNKAIDTESRRIKKEVLIKRAKRLSETVMPEIHRIDLKDRIRVFYAKILTALKRIQGEEKIHNRVSYTSLLGTEKEEKLASFLPLLHLSNGDKIWLEQEEHLTEIWVFLYDYVKKNKKDFIEELEEDINEMKEELEAEEILEILKNEK